MAQLAGIFRRPWASNHEMKSRPLAVAFAIYAVGYIVANVFFYWNGFFRYWGAGHPGFQTTCFVVDMTDRPGWISVVPLTRFGVFATTLGGLAWCARAVWRGDARARIVSIFLSLGWLAPQARYLAVYFQGFDRLPAWAAWSISAGMVALPAALLALSSPKNETPAWSSLPFGKGRLIALGVMLAWLFYLADVYLARWPWIPSTEGLILGALAALFAVVSFVGLVGLRTWAVLGALLSAALTGGYLLVMRSSGLELGYLQSSDFFGSSAAMLVAALPLLVVAGIASPFLIAIVRAFQRSV